MKYRFLEFELDCERGQLRRDGELISVENRVLDLLRFLIEERGRVIERDEVLQNVWADVNVTSHVLAQAVHTARKLIGEAADQPRVIETVRGRGIRFIAPVTEVPPHPVGSDSPAFVGRNEELGTLLGALGASSGGSGRLVLVLGEAGIGKTHFLTEFVGRAGASGARTYMGSSPQVGGIPAYSPWSHVLEARRQELGPERWQEEIGDWPVLNWALDESGPTATHSSDRRTEYHAFARYLAHVASERPTVVAIDDLHLADQASLELFRVVAATLTGSGLLLVAASRHPTSAGTDLLSGAILRRAETYVVELPALSQEEVAEVVANVGGGQKAAPLPDLFRRSGGNPFFLVSLLRSAGARGGGPLGRALPYTVRGAIEEQIAGLSEFSRQVLKAWAVLGDTAQPAHLALMLNEDDGSVLDAADPALRLGLVRVSESEGALEFVHGLVREHLYESIPLGERAELHARAAEILEELPGESRLAEVAQHLVQAGTVVPPKRVLWYSASAGVEARRRFAYEDARRFLHAAVGLADAAGITESSLFDLLLVLGEAQVRLGERADAGETFRKAASIARRLGGGDQLAEVALAVAPGLLAIEAGVVDPLVVGLLESALECLEIRSVERRAKVMARLAAALHWIPSSSVRREQLVSEALELASCGGDETRAFVGTHAVAALWNARNRDWRRTMARRAAGASVLESAREPEMLARVFAIANSLEAGELEGVEADVAAMDTLAAKMPELGQVRWYCTMYRASLALYRGNLGVAEDFARSFVKEGTTIGDANARQSFGVILASIRFHQARISEVVPQLRAMAEEFPRAPAWRAALALALAAGGDLNSGLDEYEHARGRVGREDSDQMWLLSVSLLAECAVELGAKRDAEEYLEQIEPFVDRLLVMGYGVSTWGSGFRIAGRLAKAIGQLDRACEVLERSVEFERRAGLRVWLPYSQLELGKALLARGRSRDANRASGLGQKATESALRMGLSGLADQARHVGRAARAMSV